MGQKVLDYQTAETLGITSNFGLRKFVEHIASQATQWGENFATCLKKTEVATEVSQDVRTVTRHINKLRDLGLVTKEAKRGKGGGTVVVFNSELLNFEPTDNPLTSETKEAKEIRETVFPSKPKKEPKRHYRTKQQIAEDRALRTQQQNWEADMNARIAKHSINRDLFDNFENPQRAFRAYVISKIFDAYTVYFSQQRMERFKGKDDQRYNQAKRVFAQRYHYRSMPHEFVGTVQFKHFYKLARFLGDDIDPLAYLTVQFERAEYLEDQGVSKVGSVPYINALTSQTALKQWVQQTQFYEWRYARGFNANGGKVPANGMDVPIFAILRDMYYKDRTDVARKNIKKELDMMKFTAPTSNMNASIYLYYYTVKKEIQNSQLEGNKKEALIKFVETQISTIATRKGTSLGNYVLQNILQLSAVYQTGLLHPEIGKNDLWIAYGNNNKQLEATDEEEKEMIDKGKRVEFSVSAHKDFFDILRIASECKDLLVYPYQYFDAIKEFGEEKIPLDVLGNLDIERIYNKFNISLNVEEQGIQMEYISEKYGSMHDYREY